MFTAAVDAYDFDMVGLCYVITGDSELARDATQSAWLKYWESPPVLRDPTKLRSWLLSVAANEARQRYRGSRPMLSLDAISVADREEDLARDMALEQALDALGPDEREMVGLRYLLGLNSKEIGAHLGASPGAVRVRLHRILRRLRQELRDE